MTVNPETAIASLKKLRTLLLKEGDMVLFERENMWRGHIYAVSGVTYAAYGMGHKPEIRASIDGKELNGFLVTQKTFGLPKRNSAFRNLMM